MIFRTFVVLMLLGICNLRADTTNSYAAFGSQTNLPIPSVGTGQTGTPGDFTISTISVTNLASDQLVVDVNLSIDVLHTFDQDMVISLVGPDGSTNALASNLGGGSDDYSITTFDDQATDPIAAGLPPFNGSFRPEQPLSSFSGKAAGGDWKLVIEDTSAGDTGTLRGWSLQLVTAGTNSVSRPTLTISSASPNVSISWPVSASGFTLEAKTDLGSPTWTPVQTQPVVVGANNVVTIPATGTAQFFRLRR